MTGADQHPRASLRAAGLRIIPRLGCTPARHRPGGRSRCFEQGPYPPVGREPEVQRPLAELSGHLVRVPGEPFRAVPGKDPFPRFPLVVR